MSDIFFKAAEGLGTDRLVTRQAEDPDRPGHHLSVEMTEPDVVARLGAIYALERISQESARDHWHVMEVLTAYLRENTRDWPDGKPDDAERLGDWLDAQPGLRDDLQAVFTVLARRPEARRLEERDHGLRLDLRGLKLIKPDFVGAGFLRDLSLADITGSQTLGANLAGADLCDAHLGAAAFKRANFEAAKLSRAKLSKTDLEGSHLAKAELDWAELSYADLCGANLTGANLKRAGLAKAKLRNADLTRADLGEADLTSADLEGATLAHANLGWACLEAANLSRTKLQGANLREADLTRTILAQADLARADLRTADLTNARLEGAIFIRANLGEANLSFSTSVAEIVGLRQALTLDMAVLAEGWTVSWNTTEMCWDILTPSGPYVDPRER